MDLSAVLRIEHQDDGWFWECQSCGWTEWQFPTEGIARMDALKHMRNEHRMNEGQ